MNDNGADSYSINYSSNNHDGTTPLKRHPVIALARQQLSPMDVARKRGASKNNYLGNMKQSNHNLEAILTQQSPPPPQQQQQQQPKRKCSWYTLLFPIIVLVISCSWILFVLFVVLYHHEITPNNNPSRGHGEKGRLIMQPIQQQRQRQHEEEPIHKIMPSGKSLRFSKIGRQEVTNNKQNKDSPNTTNNAVISNKKSSPSLEEAKKIQLTPLMEPIDYEKYTIRMNTWKRNEQLLVSLNHHASCEGVAQIQVIWCNSEEDPPLAVVNHPSGKVVVERHTVNSLNERFHILPNTQTPTLGILSLDDDVLRPCQAWDSGFFKWTQVPDAIVAYDYRLHYKKSKEEWQYMGLSGTRSANQYSIILMRAAFIHRDYLHLYMTYLPSTSMFHTVADNFNCEDLAMSLFVTYLRNGTKPHYLADLWAISSMVKLYSPAGGISHTGGHKSIRHQCVTNFTKELGLFSDGTNTDLTQQYELQSFPIFPTSSSSSSSLKNYIGAPLPIETMTTATATLQKSKCARELSLLDHVKHNFAHNHKHNNSLLWEWQVGTMWEALKHGLIANTIPWEERWDKSGDKSDRVTQEEYWMVAVFFHNASFLSEEQHQFVQKILHHKKFLSNPKREKNKKKKKKKVL